MEFATNDPRVNLLDAVADKCRRDELGAEYLDLIGYNPFEDDPTLTTDEVAEILLEYKETAQDRSGDDGRDFSGVYEP